MRSHSRRPVHAVAQLRPPQPTVALDLDAGRITLAGELDRHTAHQLLDAARELAAAGGILWVIDAHDLHFCDASGLRAISATYRMALRHGATVAVTGAGGWLRRALAVIRLDHHVFRDDVHRATGLAATAPYAAAVYPLAKMYTL